jgi:thiol-disulfide isomerase/thioredoxin
MSNYKKLSTFGEKKEGKSDNIPQILKIEDKKFLLQNYKICVIDVYADWCGPCKIVSPLFSKLFTKYNIPGVCTLAKENVDLKLSPNIQVVPSFQFFVYGNLDSTISGADITLVENKIIELINSTSMPPPPTQQQPPSTQQQLPPQMQSPFQYQGPAPPPLPSSESVSAPAPPIQTQNEGFQHAYNSRQQYNEAPPQLPMQLPIRRKA